MRRINVLEQMPKKFIFILIPLVFAIVTYIYIVKSNSYSSSITISAAADFFNQKFNCSDCFRDDFTTNGTSIYENPLYELVDLNNNGAQSILVTIYGNNRRVRDFYVLTKDPEITGQKDGEIKIIYQTTGAGFSPTRVSWHDAQGNFLLHSTFATSDHRPIFTIILSWDKERKVFIEKWE